jgi:hypothetical protein
MQGKKYPNAGEIVKPVQGVTNNTLLKNPYNTINEPIAKPGQRPLRITTDNRGNVFARSETMLVPGVTNNNLLKNPYNILNDPVPEKATLSLQRIKDINSKLLPDYVTENRGINEVMLQVLTMIDDKPVKLITIQLLKILITKNGSVYPDQDQQKILTALQFFDTVLTAGRRVFRENVLSPTKIPEMLRPAVDVYVSEIKKLYPKLKEVAGKTDTEIQTGLAELGLLSNALTRMFEYNNAIDPSNTLTREQIMSAALSGTVVPPVVPPAGAAGAAGAVIEQKDEEKEKERVNTQIDGLTDTDLTDLFDKNLNLIELAVKDQATYRELASFFVTFFQANDFSNLEAKVQNYQSLKQSAKALKGDEIKFIQGRKDEMKQDLTNKDYINKLEKNVNDTLSPDQQKQFNDAFNIFFLKQGGAGRKMSGSGKPKHNLRKVNKVYHQLGYSNNKYQAY